MEKQTFIALDFKTANYKRTSICSVGMVKIVDNELMESFYTLVNPNDYFSQNNIRVHGIRPKDVFNAPTFDVVFPHMLDFIDGHPVVCHNAAFDMGVLHQSIKALNLKTPDITYFCSVQLARKTLQMPRYGLSHVMKFFNLDFNGHHNALADAKTCAMITYRLLRHYPSLDEVLLIYGESLQDKDY
ncbi:3'-5' exonuclease [Staphylococcus massiliensis]|uniref:Exonuclease domain-containing protein n=1 Tax=Staphylococcus massiliensis S46 TaxID=1229783 RepID=K9AHV4_9STAP|nr:3'-5' exonuclease [Staphylococcus massiliensis]EKU46844.1 hypothetical protein C273_08591 [Staphylococcus massiliensis S46]